MDRLKKKKLKFLFFSNLTNNLFSTSELKLFKYYMEQAIAQAKIAKSKNFLESNNSKLQV